MRHRPSFLVIALVAALIGACASEPGAVGQTTIIETSAPPPCPYAHSGSCLGSLDAGLHVSSSFRPDLTYTVPDGWVNTEDLSGNYAFQKTGDTRYLAVYQNVRVPLECEEMENPEVGGGVDELVGWYTTHPGLVTTEPEPVMVGGLTGVFLDISLDPPWDMTCEYSEGQPVVPFLIKDDVTSGMHHVILPGFEERLYLLEWYDGNVAIEVGPEGGPLDDYLSEVLPIIESMSFGG